MRLVRDTHALIVSNRCSVQSRRVDPGPVGHDPTLLAKLVLCRSPASSRSWARARPPRRWSRPTVDSRPVSNPPPAGCAPTSPPPCSTPPTDSRRTRPNWPNALSPTSPSRLTSTSRWRASAVPAVLRSKLDRGGVMVFASAAALTIGVATVPVYEIYKCGHEPFWADGLDLLST